MTGRKGQFARAGAALALLGVLLMIQKDVLALLPWQYSVPARLLLLLVGGGLGIFAVRQGISAVFQTWDRQSAIIWRNLSTWTLYLLLALLVLSALGVNLSGLLVGGAILGVILGTIAQPSLGNFFAGLVLMLARPYSVGSLLSLRGTLAGGIEMEGTVTDLAALYTTLRTSDGDILKLPNSAVIGSALTIRHAPARTQVQAVVPLGTDLGQVTEAIRSELEGTGATVAIAPQSVDQVQGLVCRVEVRSPEPLDAAQLARALRAVA